MYKSILVPVDGSSHSHNALAVAQRLLEPVGGKLHVLSVQPVPLAEDSLGRAAGAKAENAEEQVQSAGKAVAERACEEAGLDVGQVDFLARSGTPEKVIVAEAKRLGVATIVMGSRGSSDLSNLVLGSVSHRVLHAAPCTVVLVR